MTIRSITLGLLLALLTAGGAYFNDSVIHQTPLVGNFLPIAVLGPVILYLLLFDPWLSRGRQRIGLTGPELLVVIALALAGCAWPGSGYFRWFATNQALPAQLSNTQSQWQQVHSYIPGGSPRLAIGQIQQPRDWLDQIRVRAQTGHATARTLLETIESHAGVDRLLADEIFDSEDRHLLRSAANRFIMPEDLPYPQQVQRRRQLVEAFPEHILPMPEGHGTLLLGGRFDEQITEGLRRGLDQKQVGIADVPWAAWWPVIFRWGGAALLVGLAMLCMGLIVHQQWSKHELLAYPIVRVFEKFVEPDDGGRTIVHVQLFWGGVILVAAIHLFNGLNAWGMFPQQLPLRLNFWPVTAILGDVGKVPGAFGLFRPWLIPMVVGFTWFLTSRVALSVGLANVLWVLINALLIGAGISLSTSADGDAPQMLSIGAAAGIAAMVIYTGRRQYLAVAAGAMGIRLSQAVPAYTIWAGRALALLVVLATWWISGAGVHWSLALMFVLLMLLGALVIARINAETGMLLVQIGYAPSTVLLAWFGFESIGPTSTFVLVLAATMLLSDPRQSLMTFIVNGLKLADRRHGATPPKAAPWMGMVIVAAFIVGLVVTLGLQYKHGVDTSDWAATTLQPSMPFNIVASGISEAAARGQIESAATAGGLAWVAGFNTNPEAWGWMGIGLSLVVICGWAMLRLPWWPLHPVIFVIWGTLPSMWFGPSFLLGWLLKATITKFGGVALYRKATPFMVGLIAGELLAALAWMTVGAGYYLATGSIPPHYSILPG